MSGFAGFDSYGFPGAEQMTWLKSNTNLVWCGYYLAPAPNHPNKSWMGHRKFLSDGGWGILPIYVGQQLKQSGAHNLTGPQGQIDGNDAVNLMRAEGFANGRWVYLDLEQGPPFDSARAEYVDQWLTAVMAGGFSGGVYCSHALADDVHRAQANARIWAFKVSTTQSHPFPGTNFPNPDPSGCGYAGAFAWQLEQECELTLEGAPTEKMQVDLSSAVSADPGA